MLEVHAAETLIHETLVSFGQEVVLLDQACGRTLAETVTADRDQPAFDRVTMDGVAFAYRDWERGIRTFVHRGIVAAGDPPTRLEGPGSCVEIMTGARLPAGADTVVPVERVVVCDDRVSPAPDAEPRPWQFVHRQGSDHPAGSRLLAPGAAIGPPEIAVLATVGASRVRVARRPAVAVVSTGNELVDVDEPVEPFQIRSSNDRAIQASLERHGIGPVTRALIPDDPDRLRREIGKLHDANDVLILSGGVSMGKYDYVPRMLAELGGEQIFHKIRQRPGKPMWFGRSGAGKPVFALPGNPVSALVCLVRYVIPGLHRAMGGSGPAEEWVQLATTVELDHDLSAFLPVRLQHGATGQCLASLRPTNTSGDLTSLAGTEGVVELPRTDRIHPAGSPVRLFRW
jgi:molybdopterin molybdotransferase